MTIQDALSPDSTLLTFLLAQGCTSIEIYLSNSEVKYIQPNGIQCKLLLDNDVDAGEVLVNDYIDNKFDQTHQSVQDFINAWLVGLT